MSANRVRELRKKKGLTQTQLAELAGTSQQQIQRIEAVTQNARYDLAVAICGALGVGMPEAFPSTELALKRVGKRIKSIEDAYLDKRAADELKEAGLDMHPERWTFRYRLRGGAEGDLPVSGPVYERLRSIVQSELEKRFLVFNSGSRSCAIATKHLMFCQFLFDSPMRAPKEDDADPERIEFYLAESAEPLTFSCEHDQSFLDEGIDMDWEGAQLQRLLLAADDGDDDRFTFEDGDGEEVFIRADDVAMFSVPLWAVNPSMSDDEEEEGDGEYAVEAVDRSRMTRRGSSRETRIPSCAHTSLQ